MKKKNQLVKKNQISPPKS